MINLSKCGEILLNYTYYIPPSFEYLIFHPLISCFIKEAFEFSKGKSMIVPRVCSNLDREVTISLVTFFISGLFTKIPVRHIDATMRREKFFYCKQNVDTFFSCLKMMKWCKKDDGIKADSLDQGEFIECEHITYSKLSVRMKSSSFFDHSERAIKSEISWKERSLFCCFFEESPISTTNIEDGCIPLRFHIF